MMIANLLLALPLVGGAPIETAVETATSTATLGGPEVEWTAPAMYIVGQPYEVDIRISSPQDGTVVAAWLLTPSAFTVGGTPLARREDSETVRLPKGFVLEGKVDLSAHLSATSEFELGYASEILGESSIKVSVLNAAPAGLNFMEIDAAELGNYQVLLKTTQGNILLKFWPEVAPNHVRNFLDLAGTGFYDGTIFHRVIPGFMIQGGDPTGTGTGDGKRQVKAEFSNDVHHTAGVLSMARSQSPDSASCQFFIMHADYPSLDGQYSAFGEMVLGADVVDAIARTPAKQSRPNTKQVIEQAIVIQAQGDE